MRCTAAGLVGVLVLCLAGGAWGGAADASLAGPMRGGMNLGLPYYPSGRGAAMGGAAVALEGGDSQNPAGLGFLKKGSHDLSINYGQVKFRHGPDVDVYGTSVFFPMPLLGGTQKLMFFDVETRHDNPSLMMGGANTDVWARQLGLAYGTMLPVPASIGKLAFGFAGFPNDPSEIRLKMGGTEVARGRGQSKIGSMRLGLLYEPTRRLSFGVMFDHIKDYLRASYTIPNIPAFGSHSNYYVNIWTLGAAYEPDDKTVISVQEIVGRAHGEGVRAHYNIPSLGIERRVPITKSITLSLRGGWRKGSGTGGFGLTLPRGWHADYAFTPNYGEELKTAFGHGPFHLVSVGKSF
jgi:hypothetical protein